MSDFQNATWNVIQLDYANAFIPDVRLNGGDENGRIIRVQLLDNGVPVDDTSVEVFLCWNTQPGVLIGDHVKMESKDSDDGRIWQVAVPMAACRMPGTVTLGFEVKRENTIVCSRSFTAIVERPVFDAGSPEGKSYRQELEDAAQQAKDATGKANALTDKVSHLIEQNETVSRQAQNASDAANTATSVAQQAAQQAKNAAGEASQAAQNTQNVISRANSAVEACDASKQAADQAARRADDAASSMKQTVQNAVERATSAAQAADSVREKTEAANKQTEQDLAALKEEVVKAQRAGFNALSSAQKCDEAAQAYRNVSGEVAQAKQTSEQAVEAANNALATAKSSETALEQAKTVLDSVKEAGEIAKRVVSSVDELNQTKTAALEATRTANARATAASDAASKATSAAQGAQQAANSANSAAQGAQQAAESVTHALQESEQRYSTIEQKGRETDSKIASMDGVLTAARKGLYMRAGDGVQITQMTQNPMDGVTISVPELKTIKQSVELASTEAADALNKFKDYGNVFQAFGDRLVKCFTFSCDMSDDDPVDVYVSKSLTSVKAVRPIVVFPESSSMRLYSKTRPQVTFGVNQKTNMYTGDVEVLVDDPTSGTCNFIAILLPECESKDRE